MDQKTKTEAAGFFRKWRHYDKYWKEEGEEAFIKYVEQKKLRNRKNREKKNNLKVLSWQ